ncbi:MAG: hypothetical protein WCW33_00840 [Candidatus Babeliales bacterium]
MKVLRSVVCASAVFFAISSLGAMFEGLEERLNQDPRYRIAGKRMEICKKILRFDVWAGLLAEDLDALTSFTLDLATKMGKAEQFGEGRELCDEVVTARFCKCFMHLKGCVTLPDAQTLMDRFNMFAPKTVPSSISSASDASSSSSFAASSTGSVPSQSTSSQSSDSAPSTIDPDDDVNDALVYKAIMQLPQWLGAKKMQVASVLVAVENVVCMSMQRISDREMMQLGMLRIAMLVAAIFQDDQPLAKRAFEAYEKVSKGI